MPKPTIKKVAVKKAVKKTVEKVAEPVIESPKVYRIDAVFNGCNFTTECTDITEGLKSFEPEMFFTDMFLTITSGEHVMERRLPLLKAKMIYRDEFEREVFINNLLLL